MSDCNITILRSEREAVGFAPESEIERGETSYFPEATPPWNNQQPRPTPESVEIRPREGRKSNTITCEVNWRDFDIEFQASLIRSLIDALQALADNGLGVLSGQTSVIDAIETIADELRKIVGRSVRRMTVPWSLSFTSDIESPYVHVHHNQSHFAFASSTGGTGSSLEMHVLCDTNVRLDGQLIDDLRVQFDRTLDATRTRWPAQKCATIALGGGEHIISSLTVMEVTFVGFQRQIETLIEDLAEIAEAVITAPLDLAQAFEKLKELLRGDDPLENVQQTLDTLSEKLAEGLREALQTFITLLRDYQGRMELDVSALNIQAITEAKFLTVTRLAPREETPSSEQQGEPPEEVPEETSKATLPPPPALDDAGSSMLQELYVAKPTVLVRNRVLPNKSLIMLPLHQYRSLAMAAMAGRKPPSEVKPGT